MGSLRHDYASNICSCTNIMQQDQWIYLFWSLASNQWKRCSYICCSIIIRWSKNFHTDATQVSIKILFIEHVYIFLRMNTTLKNNIMIIISFLITTTQKLCRSKLLSLVYNYVFLQIYSSVYWIYLKFNILGHLVPTWFS